MEVLEDSAAIVGIQEHQASRGQNSLITDVLSCSLDSSHDKRIMILGMQHPLHPVTVVVIDAHAPVNVRWQMGLLIVGCDPV